MSEVIETRKQPERRGHNKLGPRAASTTTEPGRHSDGNGLYLVVDPNGARRWVFMFRWRRPGEKGQGRVREMGLGSAAQGNVSLAEARTAATEARRVLNAGLDPIAERKKAREVPTFGVLADEVLAAKTHGLRHKKSVERWKRSLEVYAAPLRELGVDVIDTADVLGVLKPIWTAKPVTAQFARVAIEAVLDAAKAKGFRSTDNPARLRGHLDHLLAKRPKLSRGHHAAMAYGDLPGFVAELRRRDAVAALALEFLILTAGRAGEVREARWSEIDLAAKVWTLPAARMKSGRQHRVPLSKRAVEIIEEMGKATTGEFIFPGQRRGKVAKKGAPLSPMAFAMLLQRMKRDVTTHGFRSAFRDWAGSASTFPRELAEEALAHAVGDETERAYRRQDALTKRAKMMQAWANYCEPRSGSNVSQFGQRARA